MWSLCSGKPEDIFDLESYMNTAREISNVASDKIQDQLIKNKMMCHSK